MKQVMNFETKATKQNWGTPLLKNCQWSLVESQSRDGPFLRDFDAWHNGWSLAVAESGSPNLLDFQTQNMMASKKDGHGCVEMGHVKGLAARQKRSFWGAVSFRVS